MSGGRQLTNVTATVLAPDLSRRKFLTLGSASVAALALPAMAQAAPLEMALRPLLDRSLNLYNTHTGEHLSEVYWSHGRYRAEALSRINHFLRDHRSGDTHPIDPQVLDLIAAVNHKCESKGQIHIISGYRSPSSNAWLAANSDGVAFHSLHMQGKAVDIRLPGRSVSHVGHAAMSLKGGGVGMYPASDFVHVDSGRLRHW